MEIDKRVALEFAKTYVKRGFNLTKTAKAMDMSNATARGLIALPYVIDEVERLKKTPLNRYYPTVEKVLYNLMCIAEFEPEDVLDENNQVMFLNEMPEEVRRALKTIEIKVLRTDEEINPEDPSNPESKLKGSLSRYTTYDKQKAIELLGRYFAMWTDTVKTDGNIAHTHKASEYNIKERVQMMLEDSFNDVLQ